MANDTFYFDPSVDENATGKLARTPWNNNIYPGNYVAHLNAYRDQGVVAIPGAVFFRAVGALVLCLTGRASSLSETSSSDTCDAWCAGAAGRWFCGFLCASLSCIWALLPALWLLREV